jgi:hypothetical protein
MKERGLLGVLPLAEPFAGTSHQADFGRSKSPHGLGSRERPSAVGQKG